MEKVVTAKDGSERRVVADTQAELDEAVKSVENMDKPTYPNINVPVRKGHDLVEVQDDLSMKLVDGSGAHNSPRDAIRDDGSVEGNDDVKVAGLDEPAEKTQGDSGNVRPTTDEEADKNVSDNTSVTTGDDASKEEEPKTDATPAKSTSKSKNQ